MKAWDQISKPFENKEAEKGKLLIAEPFLHDDYFERSVVLLTEHNTKGSFGFILNKTIDIKLEEAISDMPEIDAPICLGGPVGKENMHFLHTLGETLEGSVKVMDGLYWGGDFEKLKFLISAKQVGPEQIRFFVGYAGWSAKQLDEELERNDWIVVPADLKHVMKTEVDNLWQEVLQAKGEEYAVISNFPSDPALN